MREIVIFEFPSNLGLKQLRPGKEPGVRRLPEWLRNHGFQAGLSAVREVHLPPPAYTMHLDETTGVRNAEAIAAYACRQAEALSGVLTDPTLFSIVIGGDCSILIGNALALKKKGRYGLFYLDGHTDFVTPDQSSTGGAAGMDLALITGYGPAPLTNLLGLRPYLKETDVWCVGNRCIEYEDYVETIRRSDIRYIDLFEWRKNDPGKYVEAFLGGMNEDGPEGFWIHMDVDVLHHDLMPAVDSPQPDGLYYEELEMLLKPLLMHPKAVGMNLTILDPDLDPDGQYTRQFVVRMLNIFEVLRTA